MLKAPSLINHMSYLTPPYKMVFVLANTFYKHTLRRSAILWRFIAYVYLSDMTSLGILVYDIFNLWQVCQDITIS